MTTRPVKKQNRKQRSPGFLDLMLAAWTIQDYDTVAQLGAAQGVSYMHDEVGKVPNDDLSFAPEIHVIKDNALRVVGVLDLDGAGQRELAHKFLAGGADGALLITPGTVSRLAVNNPKNLPLSCFPDHITVSVGQVFLPPDTLVASQALAVGTDEELNAAGFGKAGASAEAKSAA